jgi:hypothetical protein
VRVVPEYLTVMATSYFTQTALPFTMPYIQVVPGGNALWGNPSTTQVALIVPYPKHANQWFIFTADANFAEKGLCYTHIQMDFSGHSGLILDKNVEMYLLLSLKK